MVWCDVVWCGVVWCVCVCACVRACACVRVCVCVCVGGGGSGMGVIESQHSFIFYRLKVYNLFSVANTHLNGQEFNNGNNQRDCAAQSLKLCTVL